MSTKWEEAAKAAVAQTKKGIPRQQELVIGCISRPREERRTTEIEMILPWFKKRSELLKTTPTEVLIEIIRGAEYKKAEKDELIIRQGDIGHCFYIMLTGQTSVYIDTTKSDDDPIPRVREEQQDKLVNVIALMAGKRKEEIMIVPDRSVLGKFIIHFDAGKSFGEIALMSDDSVRNASIIADERTDLLVIHRDLFNSTLKAKQEAEYQERKDFIDNSPLFRNWNPKFKRLLEMSLRKETLPFDTAIIRQGQPVQGLYFILRGQAKVVMEPDKHNVQFPKMFVEKRTDSFTFTRRINTEKDHRSRESITQNQIRVRRKEGYAAAERRLANKQLDMCFVEENEIIGETEMVFELPTYMQTVICTSNTEVLVLDNKNYERLVPKKNQQTIDIMKSKIESKVQGMLHSANTTQVPMLQNVLNKIESSKPKEKQVTVETTEKQQYLAQLIDLYLHDQVSSLVEPMLPRSVYYRYRTAKRRKAKEAWETRMVSQKANGGRQLDPNVRAHIAQSNMSNKPRSRRELQNISLGPPPRNAKLSSSRPRTAPSNVIRCISSGDNEVNNKTPFEPTFITEIKAYNDDEVVDVPNIVDMAKDIQNQRRNSINIIHEGRPLTAHAPITNVDEDDYFDVETSNTVLGNLEQRIQLFHEKCDINNKKLCTRIPGLRRFELQNSPVVPIPGGTVYVKKKPCRFSHSTSTSETIINHDHVRRFMLPQHALAQATSSRHTKLTRPHTAHRKYTHSDNDTSSSSIEDMTKDIRKKPRPSTAHPRITSAVF